ncbi:MAG: amino acid ABC transporter permease [Actinomycetia bacterium]|nr:amino acid ABC transporter permease [Actinomycetes bacterium]
MGRGASGAADAAHGITMGGPEGDRLDVAPLDTESRWETFPYWSLILAGIVGYFGYLTFFVDRYNIAWERIYDGIVTTIRITIFAFILSLALGLILGLGRISVADSHSGRGTRFIKAAFRNLSRTYVEFVRGVPILPLIFFLALVIIPETLKALGIPIRDVSQEWRGILALSIIYGAYLAEVFRGGVQSIPRGQMEAGRSLGLSRFSTMRYVVLPQAMRAIIPPLGNDFIAILKDSSLLSVLAVGEITYNARQYAAGSFRFKESYVVLIFIYVSLVLTLSFLLTRLEARMTRDRQGER